MNKFRNIEKGDLHIHLNGTVKTETVIDLIRKCNIDMSDIPAWDQKLTVRNPAKNLKEYFTPWQILKRLPIGYECLEIMVESAFSFLKSDNVSFVEFRNSPFYISTLNSIPLSESLRWLVNAIELNSKKFDIKAGLIPTLTRHENNMNCGMELLSAIKKCDSITIVGLDISGDEDYLMDKGLSNIFIKAKHDLGLGITIHAGETWNLDNVIWAVNNCEADRLGHAYAASMSKSTLELIKKKEICLEISILSSYKTGNVNYDDKHPLIAFLDYNIPFVLCTDNPVVHGASLSEEYSEFERKFNNTKVLEEMLGTQKKYSFLNKRGILK